jgi:hypothetical protein
VFLAKGARDWASSSQVIIRPGNFPDDNRTSDHRSVEAVLDPAKEAVDVGAPEES